MGLIESTCTALPGPAPRPAGAGADAGSDSASPCRIMRAAADVANWLRLYGVCSCTGARACPLTLVPFSAQPHCLLLVVYDKVRETTRTPSETQCSVVPLNQSQRSI